MLVPKAIVKRSKSYEIHKPETHSYMLNLFGGKIWGWTGHPSQVTLEEGSRIRIFDTLSTAQKALNEMPKALGYEGYVYFIETIYIYE